MRKPPPAEGVPLLNILSWNVAGLRALVKKHPGLIPSLVWREGARVLCLQEHKLQGSHTGEMEAALGLQAGHDRGRAGWVCSTGKLGYSGVSVHTASRPLSVTVGLGAGGGSTSSPDSDPDPDSEHEVEGRVVTVELEEAFVVNVYVPNSGEGLKRLDYRINRWDGAFAKYVKGLESRGKPVIVTGDLNCAHKEIDIHAPKTNLRSAGFTVEERESFGRLLLGEVGLVDTFRELFPCTVAYTYFTRRFNCREQNKGWRLDYFLTSRALMPPAAAAATATVTVVTTAAATETAVAAVTAVAIDQEAEAGTALAKANSALAAVAAPTLSTPWRVYDSWILQDVYGSDHLPLGLTLIKV
ncbi:hypothetical protein VOLCADRAFT_56112 [Volvox carteri f. nagariensis]|uniref:DNA-(apurinic or apyrimidinic site) endonuclease n=1 Tax=Volvox carteri f. nagariensis TaxID=3068 RepID=D8TKL6_VOLCA|nr:uncharacterized protein VOLCADRAFT_56112 [Volvox carteri f. nagariensis]EFJ52084.1 hypothetical protein VOLCADRAFT_56112 [Volvox carteri f. nagariensis]|eukprot:XP_002946858.1 hypothetical protein VOLCADRAFT_56112 [Volvox carteri f. nagariensis]